jgi:hypothetical protein
MQQNLRANEMQHKCDEEDIFKEVKSTKFERTNRGNQQSEISLFA